MSLRNRHRYRRRSKRGFTLLELVLSLALSAMLLSALLTSLYVYYRTLDSSQSAIEYARAWSAAVDQLQQDFEHTLAQCHQPIEIEQPAELIVNDQPKSSIEERVLRFETGFPLDALALYGNESLIAFGELVPHSLASSTPRRAPLVHRLIVWTLDGNQTIQIPVRTAAGIQSQTLPLPAVSKSVLDSGQALLRIEIELDASLRIIKLSRYPLQLDHLQMHYQANGQTHSSWNSDESKTLPAAIEIATAAKNPTIKRTLTLLRPAVSPSRFVSQVGRVVQ